MTYHQANPVIGEPCLFETGVISKLNDQQWKDVTTPGTELHEKWRRQMDIVAEILKKVKETRIPVLFRPYHEMNGDWFWWGDGDPLHFNIKRRSEVHKSIKPGTDAPAGADMLDVVHQAGIDMDAACGGEEYSFAEEAD
jgi:hypothetical protein